MDIKHVCVTLYFLLNLSSRFNHFCICCNECISSFLMKKDTKRDNTDQLDSSDIKATAGMQGIEMPDYINEQPRQGQTHTGDANKSERRPWQLFLLSVGLLCIIQATLNITLRLIVHSSKQSTQSDCNTTYLSDHNNMAEMLIYCDNEMTNKCNSLQEQVNALTRDRDSLQNRNNVLRNIIKCVADEVNKREVRLRVVRNCLRFQPCPGARCFSQ